MVTLEQTGEVSSRLPANRRLQSGLELLRNYREGRLPAIAELVASQRAGDSAKVIIEGDAIYLIVQCYRPRRREQGRFEAHQHYTDVQYVCAGQEWIEVCELRDRKDVPLNYDADGNVFFPLDAEPQNRLWLRAGKGAVFFPNDAHAPCLRVEGDEAGLVRKIVVKIRDAHLPDEIPLATTSPACPPVATGLVEKLK